MNLFYKKYGENKKPLFILHGLFGMLDNWHRVATALSEEYTVYAVDQRNHGQSPHDDAMNYAIMATDLKQLMDSLDIKKATVMGHSMGGKTAMQFCEIYPNMVEKLIVVDIAPKAYKEGHRLYFEALKSLDFDSFEKRRDAEVALEEYEPNAGIRLFLLKNMTRKQGGGFELKMNLPAIEKAYPEIIGSANINNEFDGEVLFIKGANSRYIIDEDMELIFNLYPNAKIETVANAGHWVHAENYEGFLEKLHSPH